MEKSLKHRRVTTDFITPAAQEAMRLLESAGYFAYIVGGAVRDAVHGVSPNDIDIATDARPDQIPSIFAAKCWGKHPTGLKHGTWTIKRNGETFEVTTFRKDVATDGRRATVEFADTIQEDAQRRDFTMNALYMDVRGIVFDPTGRGLKDADEKQLHFVGDADKRCEEDYLRILRYFRFAARWKGSTTFKSSKACGEAAHGLENVSGERVWSELRKLLSSPNREALIHSLNHFKYFVDTDVLPPMDLDSLDWMLGLEDRYNRKDVNWLTRYTRLFKGVVKQPCSRKERLFIETLWRAPNSANLEVLAHQHGADFAKEAAWFRGEAPDVAVLEHAAKAQFPVSAADFDLTGLELGKALRAAKEFWYETQMYAAKDVCIQHALLRSLRFQP